MEVGVLLFFLVCGSLFLSLLFFFLGLCVLFVGVVLFCCAEKTFF